MEKNEKREKGMKKMLLWKRLGYYIMGKENFYYIKESRGQYGKKYSVTTIK